MTKGAKIAKSQVDVDKAEPSELVIDSTKLGSLKVHDIITLKLTSDTPSPTQSMETGVAHGLSYPPAFFATATGSSGISGGFSYKIPFLAPGQGLILKVYVDETNVFARVVTTEDNTTYTFKIIIFREKLA